MTNEEFQKIMLNEIRGIKNEISSIKESQISTDARLAKMETRQDEIYQVVTAIEYTNQVGRSELDSQNIRLAKVEGKIKKVAKVYNEDIEVDKASNL